MIIILSIETSTDVCSVALHRDGELFACYNIVKEKSHASTITLLIQHLLTETGIDKKQLSAVAVSKGPGSYTGLRIGVSTAKGLCFALGIPLIGVSTLTAMAQQIAVFNYNHYMLCPMIDARRMEVYCSIYKPDLTVAYPTTAEVLNDDSFRDIVSENKVIFFGNGSEKFKTIPTFHQQKIFIDAIYPSAQSVGIVAFKKYLQSEFEDVAYFEPYYLKEFMSK